MLRIWCIYLFSFAVAKIDPNYWLLGKNALILQIAKDFKTADNIERAKVRVDFIEELLNSADYDEYLVNRYLGKGSYGVVFGAVKTDNNKVQSSKSLKVMFLKSETDQSCVDTYLAYEAMYQAAPNPFLIQIDEPALWNDGQTFVCVMVMELGRSLDNKLFQPAASKTDLQANAMGLSYYLVNLIEGFKIMNFDAGYYHADIKPANLLYVVEENLILPRIIDFDLTFHAVTPGYNPGYIKYTLKYRPPEMRAIVPDTNPKGDEEAAFEKYKYNEEFKEEAFALGVTIKEIIKLNENEIDTSLPQLKAVSVIAERMVAPDVKTRISTKTAHIAAKTIKFNRLRMTII